MSAVDALLQRPWLDQRSVFRAKSGAVVGDLEAKSIVVHADIDIDAARPAVPNGVRNGLPKELLKVELEANGDRGVVIAGLDPAIHRPLLPEPMGEALQLFHRLGELELAVAAESRNEGADFALLLD
jgi:hypothetical protein